MGKCSMELKKIVEGCEKLSHGSGKLPIFLPQTRILYRCVSYGSNLDSVFAVLENCSFAFCSRSVVIKTDYYICTKGWHYWRHESC